MNKIKIDIPPKFDAKIFDYKSDELMKISYNYSSNSYFKKISIDNFYEDSDLISYLESYLNENNLDQKNYDIFYRKGKEWYSNFILYKKSL